MPEFRYFNGVLLARAVEVFLPLAGVGIINFSTEGLSLVVSEPSGLLKAALRIESSGFTVFDFNMNSFAPINLAELHTELNRSTGDDAITIFGGYGTYIRFQYHSTEDILFSEMILPRMYYRNWDINEFQYVYEASVAIHSEEFRNLIRHLQPFGSRVNVTVKKTHATFEVEGEETTLSTWNNQCDVRGVAEGEFVCSNFSLHQVILSASFLSTHVWICCSDTFNSMLRYQLAAGSTINIFFH